MDAGTPVSIRADQRLCRTSGPGCPLFYDQLYQQQGLFAGLSGQETHGAQTGHAAAFVGQLHQIGKSSLYWTQAR